MNKFSVQDKRYMAMALELAKKGTLSTSPNPAVGCVIVKDDAVIGCGFHHQAGTDHAEIVALKSAGGAVRGATVYVTLEPCSHYGRTPPCAKALVKAGVGRVVMAMTDPNPKVAGRGIAILKEAKIKTDAGLMQNEAVKLNRPFLKAVQGFGPYVMVKCAMSLDNKCALKDGQSKWITGTKARSLGQLLRAKCDAIITGSSTVRFDDPALTLRVKELPKSAKRRYYIRPDLQPLKVILNTDGSLLDNLCDYQVFKSGSTLLVLSDAQKLHDYLLKNTSFGAPLAASFGSRLKLNEHVGVLLLPAGADGKIDLKALLQALGDMQLRSVLVEAGSHLTSAFLDQDLADELYVFIGAKTLGKGAQEALQPMEVAHLQDAPAYKLKKVKKLGDDVMLKYSRAQELKEIYVYGNY